MAGVDKVIVVDVEDRDDSAWRELTPFKGGLSGWKLLWDRICPFQGLRCGAVHNPTAVHWHRVAYQPPPTASLHEADSVTLLHYYIQILVLCYGSGIGHPQP